MAVPNDNFNDNVLGAGWQLVGSGAVETSGQLRITPASSTPVGVEWIAGTVDLTTRFDWRVLNLGSLGFNAVAVRAKFTDPVTNYSIECIARAGWTAQLRYLDNTGAEVVGTISSNSSTDSDTYSYFGCRWRNGITSGNPGLEFSVSTTAAREETNRSIYWGNVGAVPPAFVSNFDETAVEVEITAYRAGGSGTVQIDDVGAATGDGSGGVTSTIVAAPISLTFNATQGGGNPADQTITFSNAAGISGLTVAENPDQTWLSIVSYDSGTGVATIRCTTGALTTNPYNGTIRATQAGATNTPLDVAVTFNVSAPAGASDGTMTTRTTVQNGPWTDPATWGGVAPDADDKAVVNHTVTITSAVGVGNSPSDQTTLVLDIGASGSVVIDGGTMMLKGNAQAQGTSAGFPLDLKNGGVLEFDASGATTPTTQYKFSIGPTSWNYRGIRMRSGAEIRSKVGSGNGFFASAGNGIPIDFEGTTTAKCKLTRIGSASTPAIPTWWGPGDDTATPFRMLDTVVEGCGRIFTGNFPSGCVFTMRRAVFINNVATTALDCELGTTLTAAECVMEDCAFDATSPVRLLGSRLAVRDSTFYAFVDAGYIDNLQEWKRNLAIIPTGASNAAVAFAKVVEDDVRLVHKDVLNAKPLSFMGGRASVITGLIIEPLGASTSDGEYVACGGATLDQTITNAIFLPHHDGTGMRWAEINTDNTAKITLENCSGAAYEDCFGIGHSGHTNTVERLRSRNNLFYGFRSADALTNTKAGWISFDIEDNLHPQYVDYNCGYRVDKPSRYSNPVKGYDNALSSALRTAEGLPGQHDVDVDPFPAMASGPTARLKTWAESLGVTGANNDVIEQKALKALAVRHLPTHTDYIAAVASAGLAGYRTFVRTGWTPTNEALRGAGYDGSDIGAVAMATGGLPAIGLSATTVTFNATEGGSSPTAQTVTVTNTSTGTLTVDTVAEVVDQSWLAVSFSDTGNGGTITLTPTLGALTPNTYTATVRVTDAGASNSPQDISVTFTVNAAPSGGSPIIARMAQGALFMLSYLRPYAQALTVHRKLLDSTTGQISNSTALVAGDVKVSIDGGAATNISTLPVVSGTGVNVSLSAAETTGKAVTVTITKSGYLTDAFVIETYGDFRSQHPLPNQVHSATPTAVTANGATLPSSPTLPQGSLVAHLCNSSGVVVGATGATVAGATVTFDPAFLTAPSGVATIHLSAAAPSTTTGASNTLAATALLDQSNGIEAGITVRGALRLVLAVLAGTVSGADTNTVVFKSAGSGAKSRVTSTVATTGRTSVTLDPTT